MNWGIFWKRMGSRKWVAFVAVFAAATLVYARGGVDANGYLAFVLAATATYTGIEGYVDAKRPLRPPRGSLHE